MPICPRCSNPFRCNCASTPIVFGAVAPDCAVKPGAIWVHVTDDRGIDIPKVGTLKSSDSADTGAEGTAVFDKVDPGSYTVKLAALRDALLEDFEAPAGPTDREVTVAPGQIAYVPYQLVRKPALSVRVKKKPGKTPEKLFVDTTVTIADTESRSEKTARGTGIADFKRVKAGPYSIAAELAPKDAETFATKLDFSATNEKVTLGPGEERVVEVEVDEINFVTGHATIDKKKLIIDDEPDDSEIGCVTLEVKQTNSDQPYTKRITFKCVGPEDINASLEKDGSRPLQGSLGDGVALPSAEDNDLRDEKPVKVYLRGVATAGPIEVSLVLEDPADRFVKLGKASDPDTAEIEVVARPHVKIEWMGSGVGVENVDVAFAGFGSTHSVPKSVATGFAKWAQRGIKPGQYDATFTFSDNVGYLLHDENGDPVIKPQVDLRHKGTPVAFKIRKAKVTLAAMCDTPGKPTEAVAGKVTLKALGTPVVLDQSGPKAAEVPIVEPDQKCLIQKFDLDDPGGVYELVGVEPT